MKCTVYTVWSEEDKGFICQIPEFKNLSAFGETYEEALMQAEIAAIGYIETLLETEYCNKVLNIEFSELTDEQKTVVAKSCGFQSYLFLVRFTEFTNRIKQEIFNILCFWKKGKK